MKQNQNKNDLVNSVRECIKSGGDYSSLDTLKEIGINNIFFLTANIK